MGEAEGGRRGWNTSRGKNRLEIALRNASREDAGQTNGAHEKHSDYLMAAHTYRGTWDSAEASRCLILRLVSSARALHSI